MDNSTQQNQIVKTKPKAMELMAARLNVDAAKLLETLKNTVWKGCSNEELLALVVTANEYGLNPLTKEIYAFPSKGGGIVPIVGVDGWNKMMNRSENFDGIEFTFEEGKDGVPVSCTAIIYLKNRNKPVKVTEYYSECYRNTEPWKQMPRRMLRHKTLIQVCRIGFGFSGVYDEDEGRDQSADFRTINAEPVAEVRKEIEAKPEPAPAPARSSNTKRVEEICKKFGLNFNDALNYIGEMGFPTFEECSDRLMESIVEHPALFASNVKKITKAEAVKA